jgi:hypothetical protein
MIPSPSQMNTYRKRARNPHGMNTSKIAGLKLSWNQHMQKNRGVGVLAEAPAAPRKVLLPQLAKLAAPHEQPQRASLVTSLLIA